MLVIDNIIVHNNIFDTYFVCQLSKCKGMCCVEGDAGAPLTEAEAIEMEEKYATFSRYLTPAGKTAIEKQGKWVRAKDGTLETPLINYKACAYSYKENGTTYCAIERAYREGKTEIMKPLSCHLAPIRLRGNDVLKHLVYEKWDVCIGACEVGKSKKVLLFEFLKEPIIRQFGKEFYDQLEAFHLHRQKTKEMLEK